MNGVRRLEEESPRKNLPIRALGVAPTSHSRTPPNPHDGFIFSSVTPTSHSRPIPTGTAARHWHRHGSPSAGPASPLPVAPSLTPSRAALVTGMVSVPAPCTPPAGVSACASVGGRPGSGRVRARSPAPRRRRPPGAGAPLVVSGEAATCAACALTVMPGVPRSRGPRRSPLLPSPIIAVGMASAVV